MTQRFPDDRFLSGNFAPVRAECDAPDLEIEGDWPEGLAGTFVRNGPNPLFPPRDKYHLFSGDGMIHAFDIEGGRVAYRNRAGSARTSGNSSRNTAAPSSAPSATR